MVKLASVIKDIWTYTVNIIGPIGILSDVIIIYVMWKSDRSSSTILFQSIAVFDVLVILASFNYFGDETQVKIFPYTRPEISIFKTRTFSSQFRPDSS